MQYAITAAFLLAVVAGSFAAVILGGYGIARLTTPTSPLRSTKPSPPVRRAGSPSVRPL
jgi:hypothetical protein